jgi:hypothetical protein
MIRLDVTWLCASPDNLGNRAMFFRDPAKLLSKAREQFLNHSGVDVAHKSLASALVAADNDISHFYPAFYSTLWSFSLEDEICASGFGVFLLEHDHANTMGLLLMTKASLTARCWTDFDEFFPMALDGVRLKKGYGDPRADEILLWHLMALRKWRAQEAMSAGSPEEIKTLVDHVMAAQHALKAMHQCFQRLRKLEVSDVNIRTVLTEIWAADLRARLKTDWD